MANINNFTKDIFEIYNVSPYTLQTVFKYNLLKNIPITVDYNNNTILHYIVKKNDEKTLIELLNYIQINGNKDILNVQNNNGDTALHIAVRNNNEKFAKLLDVAGINKILKNKDGEYVSAENTTNPIDSTFINLSDLSDTGTGRCLNKVPQSPKIKITRRTQDIIQSDSDSIQFLQKLKEALMSEKKMTYKNTFKQMYGGNDSSTFEIKLIDIENSNNLEQLGGAKRRNKQPAKSKRSVSTDASSKGSVREKESSKIHDNVVQKFAELGYENDDARAMKLGLYSMIKEKHSTLSNLEKAKKMLEYLEDATIINTLKKKLEEFREIIRKARELKQGQGQGQGQVIDIKGKKAKGKEAKGKKEN
jgi:hypothetical protein